VKGKRALITGGASGIGLATARRLEAEGAEVFVVDIAEVERKDGNFIRADVSKSKEMEAAFEKAAPIDIAHLNAGISGRVTEIDELTDEQYQRILGINVNGVVFGIREAVKLMKKSGGGSIVATASIAGLNAYPPDPVYGLTKHAVVGIVRALGPLLERHNITINAICPGIVETPLVGEGAARLKELGFPLIQPEEVAEAVVRAINGGGTGDAWVIQPGREPLVYKFRGVPGPRVEGAEGMEPPWELL
jgi:NAD(P)-dependent dehydrogenase (short-subunit alcohol dehydrogenase family)